MEKELLIAFIILSVLALLTYIPVALACKEEPYEDDGKPIENEQHMIIHCNVVHTGTGLYQMLDCAICNYKDECKKYRHRHNGKTPIEVLRENGQDIESRYK